jgi:hypothetical protein
LCAEERLGGIASEQCSPPLDHFTRTRLQIDERFSSESLKNLGPGRAREDLLAELEAFLLKQIEDAVRPVFDAAASRLNNLGYKLISDHDPAEDEYSRSLAFRDYGEDRTEADHQLHIHLDFQTGAAWNYKEYDEDE